MITGEGIDLHDKYILTSSWKESHQLQIWDDKGLNLVRDVDWDSLKTSFDPVNFPRLVLTHNFL